MVNGRTAKVQPPPAPGICQRFLKFLMNNLVGKGVKQVTLGGVARQPVEIPIETPSRKVRNKTSSKSNGEIVVEFRHTEGKNKKKGKGAIQDSGSPATVPNKNALIVNDGRKTESRFRGQKFVVWNGGKGKDDGEKELVVIHHQKRPDEIQTTTGIDRRAESFIKSRLDIMHKLASAQ